MKERSPAIVVVATLLVLLETTFFSILNPILNPVLHPVLITLFPLKSTFILIATFLIVSDFLPEFAFLLVATFAFVLAFTIPLHCFLLPESRVLGFQPLDLLTVLLFFISLLVLVSSLDLVLLVYKRVSLIKDPNASERRPYAYHARAS
jgi:hypothetical protein